MTRGCSNVRAGDWTAGRAGTGIRAVQAFYDTVEPT